MTCPLRTVSPTAARLRVDRLLLTLVQRIRHDIYYIENWSPWLDLQILVLTFLRWKHPE